MRTTSAAAVVLWVLAAVPVAGQGGVQPTLRPGLQIVVREDHYRVEQETLGEVIAVLNDMRLEGEQARLSQGLTLYQVLPRRALNGAAEAALALLEEVIRSRHAELDGER